MDCVGNCRTGRGYCYSTMDSSKCANCVLWDARPERGESLCSEFGVLPQGGVLPQTAAWERQDCNNEAWLRSGGHELSA